MFKKVLILTGSAVLCLFLSSCYTFQSKYIVGEKTPIENKKIGEENKWQYDDKEFFTRVIGPETLIMAALGWDKEKKEYMASNTQIVLTKFCGRPAEGVAPRLGLRSHPDGRCRRHCGCHPVTPGSPCT